MPGRENGPADAYRHAVWTALTAREAGAEAATNAVYLHEIEGNIKGQPANQEAMDTHNNEVAAQIGQYAKDHGLSEEWVIQQCQKAIKNGAQADENGQSDHPGLIWLPPDQWDKNPQYDNDPRVPPELRGKEMPKDQINWPNPDFDNPYHNNPYIPTPPQKQSETEPDSDQIVADNDQEDLPQHVSLRDELTANYRKALLDLNQPDPLAPDTNEIDPETGKKFGDMRPGEYAAALYRKHLRDAAMQKISLANDNAINDNVSGGEVQVRAHDREGGKEHVRGYTRHKPKA